MTFNHKLIARTVSVILGIEGIAMILSLGTAVYDGDRKAAIGFTISTGILLALALIGRAFSTGFHVKMKARESYFIVLICWVTMIIGGTLPYLLAGSGYGIVDSIFESVASWTTSSAWVLDVNTMPRALVLWKATSNWLGGMGIIILTILVFSALGVNAQKLAGAELRGAEIKAYRTNGGYGKGSLPSLHRCIRSGTYPASGGWSAQIPCTYKCNVHHEHGGNNRL